MSLPKNSASAPKMVRAADPMNELRLATARQRLDDSKDETGAIEALREIVGGLLGCEEIGLFKVDGNSKSFSVCWSFGANLENYDLFEDVGEEGRRVLFRGECYIKSASGGHLGAPARTQAFVPLRFVNRTIGILALLRLLPQKVAFDPQDMDLFQLLSNESARPLFGVNAQSQPVNPAPGRKQ